MAQLILKLVVMCTSAYLIHSTNMFSEVLDDASKCEDKCTKSFAPHTYPNGNENSACMRGCRLYTISKFITNDEPEHTNNIENDGLTPAKAMCHHSCMEAYNETSPNTLACNSGCDAQEIVSLQRQEDKSVDNEFHMFTPVMQIKEVVSKVFGVLRVVQSSITTYFLREDDQLVAVEGPVEVVVQIATEEDEQDSEEDLLASYSDLPKESETPLARGTASVECISRRVGVPTYLLLISSVSFSVFFLYVLFFICSSGNKKEAKVKASMPIPSHALPVKLIRPEDLTKLSLMDEDDGQAPPIPHKVKLPDNTQI